MFLSELEDTQKELFLDLSIHMSMSDGEFVNDEKKAIIQMCKEMEINERFVTTTSLDDALDKLAESTDIREKRIILLEIGGIVLADGIFSSEEKDVMKKISNSLGIEYSQCEKAISLIKDLYEVYSEIGSFLSS